MAHPHRDADAALMHARRFPAAGELTRVGRRERSLPARMGPRYSARLLMTPATSNALRAPIGYLSDRGKARPAIGKVANQPRRSGPCWRIGYFAGTTSLTSITSTSGCASQVS